jgi:hypothetical protein
LWNICRCSTMPSPWPSLIYYLFKWYCWQTYITEQTNCRWHFVQLFKSGHNAVEKMLLIMIWMKWTYDQKSVLCHLILTKQKSWFSLIVAFQKILISLLMVNQCPLPLLINTQIFHFATMLIGNTHVYNIQSGLSKHST